jgi:hypothetical protein
LVNQKTLDIAPPIPDSFSQRHFSTDRPARELDIVTKNPVFQFVIWAFFLNHPVFAQEAIEIEIDSAPVEVEIKKPPVPEQQPEPTPPKQAEQVEDAEEVSEKTAESKKGYGVAIGIGALVAAALAALGGGGGGGGGGSSTPQH